MLRPGRQILQKTIFWKEDFGAVPSLGKNMNKSFHLLKKKERIMKKKKKKI